MMNVCIIHKTSMTVSNIINCDSIVYNSTTGNIDIHGAYATSPTSVQTFNIPPDKFLIRIMSN